MDARGVKGLLCFWDAIGLSEMLVAEWPEAHAAMLPVVFGEEAAKAVCEHAQDLWSIADEVRWLSMESELGAALFRNTAATVSIVQFNQAVAELLPKLLVQQYTLEKHREAETKLYAVVDEYKLRGLPEVSRSITLPYLCFNVTVVVKDLYWECQLRLAAAMKQRALGRANGIPLLSFEEWFAEASTEESGIDAKLVSGAQTCRKMVSDMLLEPGLDSIAAVTHA